MVFSFNSTIFIDAPFGRLAATSFASDEVVRLVDSDADEAIYAHSYSSMVLLTMILLHEFNPVSAPTRGSLSHVAHMRMASRLPGLGILPEAWEAMV
jgi:hypothetical protein